ncbi:hypothetical protein DFQ30_006229 [Apophysomyces sp. BC1015]|nr:hypothetical protein DFQ30_006229 [Apophysomyces sp. BC1015]
MLEDGHEDESTTSRNIDRQIKRDRKQMKREVKLLLLGAGESGKSTVLKQMRLIHASGFKPAERKRFRTVIFSNVINTMETLLEAVDQLQIPLENALLESYRPLFTGPSSQLDDGQPFPPHYLAPLKELWMDAGIQMARKQGNMFALHDNLDTLWNADYVPTDQDILRCRAKTTGIVETNFHLGHFTIHCFENVTAVLFVVAISGYDQCLVEDRDSNQMHESLMLFDNICSSPWFTTTSMILLLNKIDIFRKKISYSPISQYFADYEGKDDDVEAAQKYFKKNFQRLNRNGEKQVYVHFTDATDTNLLQHVMSAVSDIILNENLGSLVM